MKIPAFRHYILAMIAVISLPFMTPLVGAQEAADTEAYLIHPGDVLGISVWREDSLQAADVLVRPDGRISFPLVENVRVAGKTVSQVNAEIAAGLQQYIPDPVVHVTVRSLSGNIVYVIGKVARPGVFPMSSQVDVVQALAMAGGMTAYAAANKVRILRRENGTQTAIPFAYGDIEKGENLGQNIILQAGDVVLVP